MELSSEVSGVNPSKVMSVEMILEHALELIMLRLRKEYGKREKSLHYSTKMLSMISSRKSSGI